MKKHLPVGLVQDSSHIQGEEERKQHVGNCGTQHALRCKQQNAYGHFPSPFSVSLVQTEGQSMGKGRDKINSWK